MSRLFLIRHAQASFLEPNYDKLSLLGEKQAILLGDYWARHEMVFHRAVSGPCVRQKDTAEIVSKVYQKAGLKFPELVMMPDFDEYQGEAVIERSLPGLVEKDGKIRNLHRNYLGSGNPADRAKTFQKLFEAVITGWVGGEISVPGVESWAEFCARVNRGISHFIAGGSNAEQTAIFCSGGPIAVAMQRALNLSPQDTLRTAWMSRNCSFSEFVYSGERFTLSSFNAFPHLDEARLLTYR